MSKLNQQAQSVNPEFPPVRPILDLRFALAKKLDPRVTFTRGTTGTYVGPDGVIKTAVENEPRFDHDSITGESKGLLMEQSRTNLMLYSEDMSNWSASNVNITTNATTSPDGNLTADRIYDNTTTSQKWVVRNISGITAGTAITASVFVKFDSSNRNFILEITDAPSGGSKYSAIRLYTNGTYNTVVSDFSNTRVGIFPYLNGWYRVYVSLVTSTITTISTRLVLENTSPLSTNYIGDGNSGLYVWGAQLEAGTYPTSYMPTTASQFSRGGEYMKIDGTNFSNLFNNKDPDELSIYFVGQFRDSGIDRNPNDGIVFFELQNSNVTERITQQWGGLPNYNIYLNGSSSASGFTSTLQLIDLKTILLVNTKEIKIISSESNPNYQFATTPGIPRMPTGLSRLSIGGYFENPAQINGPVERFAIYSKKLSVNQAQSLTL